MAVSAEKSAIDEVADLKRSPGKDIVLFGSAMLASTPLEAGLVDEYRVIISPVLYGRGHQLFGGLTRRMRLRLLRTQPLPSGIVILSYEPSDRTSRPM